MDTITVISYLKRFQKRQNWNEIKWFKNSQNHLYIDSLNVLGYPIGYRTIIVQRNFNQTINLEVGCLSWVRFQRSYCLRIVLNFVFFSTLRAIYLRTTVTMALVHFSASLHKCFQNILIGFCDEDFGGSESWLNSLNLYCPFSGTFILSNTTMVWRTIRH